MSKKKFTLAFRVVLYVVLTINIQINVHHHFGSNDVMSAEYNVTY